MLRLGMRVLVCAGGLVAACDGGSDGTQPSQGGTSGTAGSDETSETHNSGSGRAEGGRAGNGSAGAATSSAGESAMGGLLDGGGASDTGEAPQTAGGTTGAGGTPSAGGTAETGGTAAGSAGSTPNGGGGGIPYSGGGGIQGGAPGVGMGGSGAPPAGTVGGGGLGGAGGAAGAGSPNGGAAGAGSPNGGAVGAQSEPSRPAACAAVCAHKIPLECADDPGDQEACEALCNDAAGYDGCGEEYDAHLRCLAGAVDAEWVCTPSWVHVSAGTWHVEYHAGVDSACAGESATAADCIASCSDWIQNQGETDVDCGGSVDICPARCVTDMLCQAGDDCEAGVCTGDPLRCQPPRCDDGVRNGSETGDDCGGSCALYNQGIGGAPSGHAPPANRGACAHDAGCRSDLDCISGNCDCTTENCDMGSCVEGSTCTGDSDCSGMLQGRCEQPSEAPLGICISCDDRLHTGDETDVDCGGAECPACGAGMVCRSAEDCAGGLCLDSHCALADSGYYTSGAWHGYAWTLASPEESSVDPIDFSTHAAGAPYCAEGTVAATSDSSATAMIGFNVSQAEGAESGESWVPATVESGGIRVNVSNLGGSALRVQILGEDPESASDRWCFDLTVFDEDVLVSWAGFNTACWDGTGSAYAGQPITAVDVQVAGSTVDVPYSLCVSAIGPDE